MTVPSTENVTHLCSQTGYKETVTLHRCRICNAEGAFATYLPREMMFGSREEFPYFQCENCGCLQIESIPNDLHRHYPKDYYSQQPTSSPVESHGFKRAVIQHYCRQQSIHPNAAYSRILQKFLPTPLDYLEVGEYLRLARLREPGEAILDVGCGASPKRLAAMLRCGFTNVLGIDPFLPASTNYHGVTVTKCLLNDLTGDFGLIMFHHSLEHVPDPLAELRTAARRLRPGGLCLVRIPIMGTFFWREFGCDWAELDAPRHLHLMSKKTVEWLCAETGLVLENVKFDSEGWELAASELYRRGIPMFTRTDPGLQSNLAGLTAEQNAQYSAAALSLNHAADSGRACFYLRRPL